MKLSHPKLGISLLSAASLVASYAVSSPVLAADPGGGDKQAVVIGISHYPERDGHDDSTDNDIKLMDNALSKRGFKVTILKDDKATFAGITGTLQSVGHCRQFVLYFAGKSVADADNNVGYLQPFDCGVTDRTNWMSGKDLRAAVEGVPANSRTIILDTRASGTLMAAEGSKPICYCVACKAGQSAATKKFDVNKTTSGLLNQYHLGALGKQENRGVFTNYLAETLSAKQSDLTWGQIMEKVDPLVEADSGGAETPDLTSDYRGTPVFDIDDLLLAQTPNHPNVSTSNPNPGTPVPTAPTAPPAKTYSADASAQLTALWTDKDGNVDDTKAHGLKASDVSAALTAGADPNAADRSNLTVLIIAAGCNRPEVVSLALSKGADINFKNDGVGTALIMAAKTGSVSIVKALLEKHADVTAETDDHTTALVAAKAASDGKTPDQITTIVNLLTTAGETK